MNCAKNFKYIKKPKWLKEITILYIYNIDNMSNFFNDLKLGQYYETKYIEKRKFKNYNQAVGAFKDWDIQNLKKGKTYEVKADRKTSSTGNLFIEYECNGEKSGINATKADVWIHFVCLGDKGELQTQSEYFYKIPIDILRQKITDSDYTRTVSFCGDGGRVNGYLFSEKIFEEYKIEYKI